VNVQEYISSGIIESYVMGLASQEDNAEFERICVAHAEVRVARELFESQLEESLIKQRIEPPREIKSSVFSKIGMEQAHTQHHTQLKKPVLVPRVGFARNVAAVALILLAGSVLLNLYLIDQYKKSIAQNKELLANQMQIAGSNQSLQTRLETYDSAFSLMKNPLMAVVKMPGVATSPDPASLATVYWNTESKAVYLFINNLPKPVVDKQYQLWAIVDGKPVDAGVFDLEKGVSFVKLKTTPKAEAFAITLEKRGGSQSPTLAAMYVMGKVNG
jgi:anti-sigma-K factor RskA